MTPPGTAQKKPGDRHLAELGINRTKQMRGYAIDGTLLTPQTVWQYLEDQRRRKRAEAQPETDCTDAEKERG